MRFEVCVCECCPTSARDLSPQSVSHQRLLNQGAVSYRWQTLILRRSSTVYAHDVHDRLEVDVLITGCEASLWIGEQFASDLQDLFPALRVVAMSANKIIGITPCFC
jgi:hypothetical protein